MSEFGRHDARIEADKDESEIWTGSVAEIGDDCRSGRDR
jgi:hypothetical protein